MHKATFGLVGFDYEREYDFWDTGKYLLLSENVFVKRLHVSIYDFKS